ncbi:Imm27 family immunity protein [Occallatibacter riparius]|uniref:Imm27 family immunity protein n=1 Tax=Occallatibacter riparius TaxID=1002689 RepID=A0A9J7BFU0_9BACT|nr:Imm27 family immunity protein [Occallatibacter riparius]UWZ81640.1 Imm27 family immunity protein [Occallatibacter riparius]
MEIRPEESLITGAWVLVGGRVVNDESLERIHSLVSGHLERVATGNWEILYRDPRDGRYWEMFHPHGEMHGGGPASLRVLDVEAAREKYGVDRLPAK